MILVFTILSFYPVFQLKNEVLNSFNSNIEQNVVFPQAISTARSLSKTGSFSTCDNSSSTSILETNGNQNQASFINNVDEISSQMYTGILHISCHSIHYKFPKSFNRTESSIIVGVLSQNSREGQIRRQSIRNTWAAKDQQEQQQTSVFFLLAGPWNTVKNEFAEYNDLLWIDKEEVYSGEESVLTLKTFSFIGVVYIITKREDLKYTHIFKTDDDSYVDLNALQKELVEHRPYVGNCQLNYTKVVREGGYKWAISNLIYPEEYFPKYCQGAGYALSRDFVNCAYSDYHIANMRFMPLEDVAVGMLAKRCGFEPSMTTTGEIKLTRYDSKEARDHTKSSKEKDDEKFVPITACMTTRIVQHRVLDEQDMEELHKTVQDPLYCKVTRRRRGKIIKNLESRGIEWFG